MGFREEIFEFAETYMVTTLEPHQLDWLEQIHEGGKRVLVLAPRGHGKSTIIRRPLCSIPTRCTGTTG